MTNDDIDTDADLAAIEAAKKEWGLDEKQARALVYIRKGLPIKRFADVLNEDLWLRELVKDLESSQCRHCKKFASAARSKAIQLLGEFMGLIGSKSKKKSRKEVTFYEE